MINQLQPIAHFQEVIHERFAPSCFNRATNPVWLYMTTSGSVLLDPFHAFLRSPYIACFMVMTGLDCSIWTVISPLIPVASFLHCLSSIVVCLNQSQYEALQDTEYILLPPRWQNYCTSFCLCWTPTLRLKMTVTDPAFRWCRLLVLVFSCSPSKCGVCPKKK